jgi:ArpU family phage transcriptional regulator
MVEGDLNMFTNKMLSMQNLEKLNFDKTKKNVKAYFDKLEIILWEWNKLKMQTKLTTNYDFTVEYSKQPYIPIGKDEFNIVAKDQKETDLKNYISSYYWAINTLSDKEQDYINKYFIENKYEDEIVDILGLDYADSYEFKKLKKSAVFKFADFLGLAIEKQ